MHRLISIFQFCGSFVRTCFLSTIVQRTGRSGYEWLTNCESSGVPGCEDNQKWSALFRFRQPIVSAFSAAQFAANLGFVSNGRGSGRASSDILKVMDVTHGNGHRVFFTSEFCVVHPIRKLTSHLPF